MSTFQALALLLGGAISSVYVLVHIQGVTQSLLAIIVTGVEDGVPVSIEYLWALFWNNYLPAAMYALFLAAFGCAASIYLGNQVDDAKLRMLAFLLASGAGLSAAFWALGIVNGSIFVVSTLKKASRN